MKKTAEKSKGAFTWKLGFQVSPASKWGGEMMKGLKRVGMVGVVVVNVLGLVLAPVGNVPANGAGVAFRLKTI